MAATEFERRLLRELTLRNLDFWRRANTGTGEDEIATLLKDNARMQQAIASGLADPELWASTVDTVLDIFRYVERLHLEYEWVGWVQEAVDAAPHQEDQRFAHLLNRLGQMKRTQGSEAAFAEAFALHRRALELAQRLADPLLEGAALFQLAEDHRLRQQPELARPLAERSRELYAGGGVPPQLLGSVYGTLGLLALDRGELAQASGHFHEALALFQQGRADLESARVLMNLGLTYTRLGKPAAAQEKFLAAEQIFIVAESQHDLSLLRLNLGSYYYQLAQYEAAEKSFKQINTRYLRERGHTVLLALTAHGLGDVAHAQGDAAGGLPFLTEAITLWRQQEMAPRLAYSLATRVGVLQDLKRPQEAADDRREAEEIIAAYPGNPVAAAAHAVLRKWEK